MANPFLFEEVPAEPVNPFLANDAPMEPVNPFLMGGAMGMQSQQQPAFGAQDVGNPFSSYGGASMFSDNSASSSYYYQANQPQQAFAQQPAQQYAQQQSAFVPQQQQAFAPQQQQQQQPAYAQPQQQQTFTQPHQQQFVGQFGSYTQVTADSFSQPSVSSAQPSSQLTGVAAFGIEASVEAPVVVEQLQEKIPEFPTPPPVVEEQTSVEEDTTSLPPPPPAEVIPVAAPEPDPEPEPVQAAVEPEVVSPVAAEVNLLAEDEMDFTRKEPEEKINEESEEEPKESASAKEEGFGDIFNKPVEADESAKPGGESVKSKSIGASLFGVEDEPIVVSSHEIEPEFYSSQSSEEEEPKARVEMSTGEAIFADLPTVPDIHSTGAALFGMSQESAKDTTGAMLFGVTAPRSVRPALGSMSGWDENFDKKFETAVKIDVGAIPLGDPYDPFGCSSTAGSTYGPGGFGLEDGFGSGNFLPPAPQSTPAFPRKVENEFGQGSMADNPFLSMVAESNAAQGYSGEGEALDDGPLFDDDTSQPLEPFPRLTYDGEGWEMYIRSPPKKKLTAHRFWKKVYVKLIIQADTPCIQLFDTKDSKDAFQELPLQPAYSVSDIAHQVFDQYTKIFTIKLQYIFYKERAGIRPGQISKMQKLAGKVGFLAKAVEDADYEGVKEFASDMKKLGVPLEHAPQVSELLKLGSHNYEDLKQFTICIEEKLFRMDALRDRSLTYKTEEIQLTAVDEIYVEQNKNGHIVKHLCRIRVFFLSFLTGMPDVELGVNDMKRMGLEVVGRHDILPIPTEQWIRYEDIEFHSVVDKTEFEKNDHIIKFRPPDACYIEIMRFRIRPPKARELPMQARCIFEITGNKVVIRADMMIPYPHTKAWGQVPCEDVCMRIPLPECWIYQFRTEKHHVSLSQLAAGNLNLSTRMGSVKSAHRRAGKVKGIERFLGALETQTQELMETSSGQAKYEHQHRAIVWRVPRLPKQGQGSYTNHEFVCRLQLTSFDQMPENFDKHFYVEFTQPATCDSNTVLRSVSVINGSGEPPEKFVKYLARHEYRLEIEFTEKEVNTYIAVAKVKKEESPVTSPAADPDFPDENGKPKDSDSDSD